VRLSARTVEATGIFLMRNTLSQPSLNFATPIRRKPDREVSDEPAENAEHRESRRGARRAEAVAEELGAGDLPRDQLEPRLYGLPDLVVQFPRILAL